MPQNKIAKLGILVLAVLLFGGLDQWSKDVAGVYLLNKGWEWGIVKLVNYRNPWIAFSIPLPMTVALILIIGLLVILLVLLFNSRRGFWYDLGLLLAISGGVSNLWDKWQLGYVRDFVSVGWLPVFNLADVLIFVGVIMIISSAVYGKRY